MNAKRKQMFLYKGQKERGREDNCDYSCKKEYGFMENPSAVQHENGWRM